MEWAAVRRSTFTICSEWPSSSPWSSWPPWSDRGCAAPFAAATGFLDGHDAHHAAAHSKLTDALHNGDRFAMAASAFAECLVGPARRGDVEIRRVHDLFDRLPITVVPLGTEIAVIAARLRAQHPTLRLPDALVIATAIDGAADELVTTDRKWPTAKALKIKTKFTHF